MRVFHPVRRLGLGLIVLLLTAGGLVSAVSAQTPGRSHVYLPTVQRGTEASAAAVGRQNYVVVLKSDVADPGAVAAELARRHQGEVGLVYQHALKGFSVSLPAPAVAALQRDPRVASVEADQEVFALQQTTPTGIRRAFADQNTNLDIDGADDLRIDVDVAVIDSGIDSAHPDLNVVAGYDCSTSGVLRTKCAVVSAPIDDNGHGTHVAGTIAALDNGIGVVGMAPGARLWSVKVLKASGSGYMSGIVGGIDYVTANADQIEVANMSLGCECTSAALDTAIANSVAAGVVYVVAAGNNAADAATFSPANHPDVITVSALADSDGQPGGTWGAACRTDQEDTLADFSNYGSTAEIAAPGVCILSTWSGGGYNTISGTSMASPHAAGAAALRASMSKPRNRAEVFALRANLVNAGNQNWTDQAPDGIRENLLDVGNMTTFAPATVVVGGGGGTNAAPTAAFTVKCTGLACSFNGSSSTDVDGTVATYAWSFGDGSTASGVTATHTYAAAGTYAVQLVVTDDGGLTGSATKSVKVRSR